MAGRFLRAVMLAGAAVAGSAYGQTPGALVASPAQLAFNVSNYAFSQTIRVASDSDSVAVDVTVDGGSANVPAPAWIELSSRALTTPGQLRVVIGRLPAAGKYSARILFRTRVAGAVAVVVPVTLEVSTAPTAFTAAPESLEFLGQVGNFIPGQYIVLRGASCSDVTVRTLDDWLAVFPEPIQNCNRFLVSLRGTLRSRGYRGTITLTMGSTRIDVPVTAYLAPAGPILGTAPNGLQFETRQGNGNAITRNVTVRNWGTGSFEWSARVVEAAGPTPWLTLGATSGTAGPGQNALFSVTVAPGGLASGTYYGLIEVTAAGARSSPDVVPVLLQIEPANSPAVGTPSPSGMLFSVVEGSAPSASQAITIFTSSTTAVPFRAAGQEENPALSWLVVAPDSGTTSTAAPGRSLVWVRPGNLTPGVYRGVVNTIAGSRTAEVRSVNITMVIRPRPQTEPPPSNRGAVRAAEGCTPSALAPTHTGLVSNFSTRVGWPTPLNLRIVDDCGDPVRGAQAVLSFSNGDPPLVLTNLLDGNYVGTWVARNPATDSMTIRAEVAQATLSATLELTGRVAANATPIVAPNGVVNNFDRQPFSPLAPGTLVEIYGTNLAGGVVVANLENGRLPEAVNDVSVLLGTTRLPLYAVSPGMINAQLPMGAGVDQVLPLVVRSGNSLSVPVRVPVVGQQPGLLAFPDTRVIAHDENFALIGTGNPARRGRPIVLYLVGMGVTSPEVASGFTAPGNPLAQVAPPRVTFGDRQAQVLFAGLTPGFVGLYQVNVVVPADLAPGEVPVAVAQGEASTSTVRMQVQ